MSTHPIIASVYNHIRAKILFTGPITVADYMKMALTMQPMKTGSGNESVLNGQTSGYYMNRDVFGEKGDFITSPEISQMFGEIIGVWGLDTWKRIGGPNNGMSIIELGPGRGTLASDLIRVYSQLRNTSTDGPLEINLVEISQYLCKHQHQHLCDKDENAQESMDPSLPVSANKHYYSALSRDNGASPRVPIRWYNSLTNVPRGFHFYIAHEFFDALPIHQLRKINGDWRELLVDVESTNQEPKLTLGKTNDTFRTQADKFRFVISRYETPIIQLLKTRYPNLLKNRTELEVSLDGIQILEELVLRLEEDGGIVLIIDYGHEGTTGNTFRACSKHRLVVDPLENPGENDLTADVDFSILQEILKERAWTIGPISQGDFLKNNGIQYRLEYLTQQCKTKKERLNLQSGFHMMTGNEEMGTRFKCIALLPKILKQYQLKLKITGF